MMPFVKSEIVFIIFPFSKTFHCYTCRIMMSHHDIRTRNHVWQATVQRPF